MKIRILTNAKIAYNMYVESKDFEEVVKKIVEQNYIFLNNTTVLLTSSIVEIQKI